MSARTAQSNQLRGLLTEFGIVMPRRISVLEKRMPQVIEDAENGLPGISRELFARLYAHFKELSGQVAELERQIKAWHRENAVSQRLEAIPGIEPLGATALAASIGDARVFKNGRQFAAWLGLVPRQCSSGGKERLLRISKRGDSYLRTLLIHGARSVLLRLKRRADQGAAWLAALVARRSPNVAAVVLANKNARVIWALLAHGRDCQADYIAEQGGYDKIFFVFDRDGHESFDRARAKIKGLASRSRRRLNIREAISIPCFELWVLLHSGRTDRPFQNCAAVVARIRGQH